MGVITRKSLLKKVAAAEIIKAEGDGGWGLFSEKWTKTQTPG